MDGKIGGDFFCCLVGRKQGNEPSCHADAHRDVGRIASINARPRSILYEILDHCMGHHNASRGTSMQGDVVWITAQGLAVSHQVPDGH